MSDQPRLSPATVTRSTIIACLLLTVAVLGASCSGKGTDETTSTQPGDEPKYGGSVVFGVGDESTGWMPSTDRWGTGPINMARSMFDPLVVVGDDGQLHPWLAESFTPQDGNKTWMIAIRKGITFTNGEPVDSHAVVYNLQAYKNSALTGFAYKPVVDIQKADDYTVKVTLDQPWGNFPAVFTGQAGFIVAPQQLRENFNDRAIGSGPFVFQSWKRDTELVVTKNKNYWRKDPQGRQLPYLEQVKWRPVADEASRKASISTGDLDIMHTSSKRGVQQLIAGQVPEGAKVLFDTSQGDEMVVIFNTQTGPAKDERLRKALQLATDRKAIAAQYDDAFEVADGPFTEKSPWWTASGWPDPDLAKARDLLAQYQADNPGPVKISLSVAATPDGLESAQLVQQQWSSIGVETQIESQEVTKFSGTLVGGGYQAILFQFWNGEDPDVNYHFWTGANIGPEGGISLNFPRWSNPETDAALNTGRAESDPAKRKAAYATVWKQWAEHVPFLWILHSPWAIVYRDNVHGLDQVNLPDGKGKAQTMTWGTLNLSNTWTTTK